jgi:hypothetical protein
MDIKTFQKYFLLYCNRTVPYKHRNFNKCYFTWFPFLKPDGIFVVIIHYWMYGWWREILLELGTELNALLTILYLWWLQGYSKTIKEFSKNPTQSWKPTHKHLLAFDFSHYHYSHYYYSHNFCCWVSWDAFIKPYDRCTYPLCHDDGGLSTVNITCCTAHLKCPYCMHRGCILWIQNL